MTWATMTVEVRNDREVVEVMTKVAEHFSLALKVIRTGKRWVIECRPKEPPTVWIPDANTIIRYAIDHTKLPTDVYIFKVFDERDNWLSEVLLDHLAKAPLETKSDTRKLSNADFARMMRLRRGAPLPPPPTSTVPDPLEVAAIAAHEHDAKRAAVKAAIVERFTTAKGEELDRIAKTFGAYRQMITMPDGKIRLQTDAELRDEIEAVVNRTR